MTKFRITLFKILGILSLLYYIICIIFAGPLLSFVWIWLLLTGFCFLRAYMLTRKMQGKEKWLIEKMKERILVKDKFEKNAYLRG